MGVRADRGRSAASPLSRRVEHLRGDCLRGLHARPRL